MLKYKRVNQVYEEVFSDLVTQTYGRPYKLQQQDGCKPRGIEHFTVPVVEDIAKIDYEDDAIPEVVGSEGEYGVSFKAWLSRDPKTPVRDEAGPRSEPWYVEMFWHRNFYPCLDVVVNDLHAKGLIPAGDYQILIEW